MVRLTIEKCPDETRLQSKACYSTLQRTKRMTRQFTTVVMLATLAKCLNLRTQSRLCELIKAFRQMLKQIPFRGTTLAIECHLKIQGDLAVKKIANNMSADTRSSHELSMFDEIFS